MNRHQRRKRSRERKEAQAAILMSRALHVLKEERAKASLSDPRLPKRSPKGMGNLRIYSGNLYPAPGFGTGAFKPDNIHLNDRGLAAWKKGIDKRKP